MFSIIQISKFQDFQELSDVKKLQNVSACEFSNLENNTQYYWRVKNVNEFNGLESDWSQVCSFTTIVESIVININNDMGIYFEFSEIEILPKVCEALDSDLRKNRCHPELEIPIESTLGTCSSENKVLTNC